MKISLICAIAENGTIGGDNTLLWHLPKDLRSFKKATSGHTIIMGRKTYESINRPLPKRINVIITRQTDYHVEGCVVVHSLEAALDYARQQGESEAFVIGGAEIYQLALLHVHEMILTHVKANVEGDTFFPEWDLGQWQEQARDTYVSDEKHAHAFDICTYVRKS